MLWEKCAKTLIPAWFYHHRSVRQRTVLYIFFHLLLPLLYVYNVLKSYPTVWQSCLFYTATTTNLATGACTYTIDYIQDANFLPFILHIYIKDVNTELFYHDSAKNL